MVHFKVKYFSVKKKMKDDKKKNLKLIRNLHKFLAFYKKNKREHKTATKHKRNKHQIITKTKHIFPNI